MTLAERERVIEEILDEVFGFGPLEPLLKDPTISDILVNGLRQGLRRAPRRCCNEYPFIQGRRAPAAHHREDRVRRRPPNR